jgi:GDP-L-fucose synthase
MQKDCKIFVAGHNGLIGLALVRALRAHGYDNLLLRPHAELDLARQADVEAFFAAERPDVVFLAAAKVGGIGAMTALPADFIATNLAIALNVIEAARRQGAGKLINLVSSCIYPPQAPQPLSETAAQSTGPLDPVYEAEAIVKIAALRLCQCSNQQHNTEFLSALPANIYGLGDHYNLDYGHVLPALIRKFHEAKMQNAEVTLWGDGSPLREFLHASDLAEALVLLMEQGTRATVGDLVNLGSGQEISIRELAGLVAKAVGYTGAVHWDASKPNGFPRRRLDSSRILALGWKPRIPLGIGITLAYQDFLAQSQSGQ